MHNPAPQIAVLAVAVAVATVIIHELLALPTPEMQATMQAADSGLTDGEIEQIKADPVLTLDDFEAAAVATDGGVDE